MDFRSTILTDEDLVRNVSLHSVHYKGSCPHSARKAAWSWKIKNNGWNSELHTLDSKILETDKRTCSEDFCSLKDLFFLKLKIFFIVISFSICVFAKNTLHHSFYKNKFSNTKYKKIDTKYKSKKIDKKTKSPVQTTVKNPVEETELENSVVKSANNKIFQSVRKAV